METEKMKRISLKTLSLLFFCACAATATAETVLTPNEGVANQQLPNLVNVDYIARTPDSGYGYQDGYTPIGITFLAWACPNSSWDVNGMRLNFGWGAYRHTTGLDLGVFSASENSHALQINVFGNLANDTAQGVQIGLVNVGMKKTQGCQIGLINFTNHLQGAQFGLLNFNLEMVTLPIFNFGW